MYISIILKLVGQLLIKSFVIKITLYSLLPSSTYMVKYKNVQLSPLKRELVADFYRKLDEKYKLPCVN